MLSFTTQTLWIILSILFILAIVATIYDVINNQKDITENGFGKNDYFDSIENVYYGTNTDICILRPYHSIQKIKQIIKSKTIRLLITIFFILPIGLPAYIVQILLLAVLVVIINTIVRFIKFIITDEKTERKI